jgi:hypothetical protein
MASEIATMREALVAQLTAILDRRDELRRCMASIEATAARDRRVLSITEMDAIDLLLHELRELNSRLERLGAGGCVC